MISILIPTFQQWVGISVSAGIDYHGCWQDLAAYQPDSLSNSILQLLYS
jgi:hypothetical protein